MKIPKLNYFNINLTKRQLKIILIIIIVLIISLLFRKKLFFIVEKLIVFFIIFLIILILTKNIFISAISSIIIFSLINITITYKKTVENFADESKEKISDVKEKESDTKESDKKESDTKDKNKESLKNLLLSNDAPLIDLSLFNTDKVKSSASNLQKVASQLAGKIELKESDTVETDKLGLNDKKIEKYSNNDIPSPLQQAQKETYELINTVAALKDTLTTMTPVLTEGRKLMDMFQNFKL
jgi:hypothetical protein